MIEQEPSPPEIAVTDAAVATGEPAITWDPPGPGSWRSLADHFPGAVTPIYAAIHAHCTQVGFATMFSQLGVPARSVVEAHVNGHTYISLQPLLLAGTKLPAPPWPVVWLMSRLHPSFRQRASTARSALELRPWRDALSHWRETQAPLRRQANATLASADPVAMTDAELIEHGLACAANLVAGHTLHFELHGPDLAPIGLLLVAGQDWGLDQGEILDTLGGLSPASASMAHIWAGLNRAVSESTIGPSAGVGAPRSLDEVRAASPEARRLLDDLLAERGWSMVTSYDLDGLALIEMPELILASIAQCGPAPTESVPMATQSVPASTESVPVAASAPSERNDTLAQLRDRVPPSARAQFDDLHHDACAAYGLRDENGPVNVQIPTGLLRRALLESGRRLAERGTILEPSHVFEMKLGEVTSTLGADPGPGPETIAQRGEQRARLSRIPAPRHLGPPEILPAFDALPPAMARISAAMACSLEAMQSQPPPDKGLINGQGINRRTVRGRACVARDVNDALGRLGPGDILVTPFTSPAHNCLLPLVAGLVVAEGGQFSHAAVMARELGLTAVVGATQAMSLIDEGDLIEVDPVAGTVRVVTN